MIPQEKIDKLRNLCNFHNLINSTLNHLGYDFTVSLNNDEIYLIDVDDCINNFFLLGIIALDFKITIVDNYKAITKKLFPNNKFIVILE